MVAVGNAGQISGICLHRQNGLIQFIKKFFLGRGGKSQHITLDFIAGYMQGVFHSRFLLCYRGGRNGGRRGFFGVTQKGIVHFFHSYVEVGAAKAKGGHVGAADFAAFPILRFGNDAEGAFFPIHIGVGGFKINRGRQYFVVQGQRGFNQCRNTGRRFGMADLAFDTAQPDTARGRVRAERFGQRGELHGIAHAGAGAVGFQQAHIRRRIIQLFKSFFHGNFLPLGVRRGNAFASAVGRGPDGADQRVDTVAVFYGVGKAFQNHHTGPFGHHKSVRARVKRIGAVRGQCADFAKLNVGRRRHHLVHTAGNSHIKIAQAQAVDGLVHRRKRSGTGRINGKVSAVFVKHIGHTPRNHVGEFAGHGVLGYGHKFFPHAGFYFAEQLFGMGRCEGFVSGCIFKDFVKERAVEARVGHFAFHPPHGVADNNSGTVVVIRFFIVAGILQGHAGCFYGQALYRIHLLGNLRRDTVF